MTGTTARQQWNVPFTSISRTWCHWSSGYLASVVFGPTIAALLIEDIQPTHGAERTGNRCLDTGIVGDIDLFGMHGIGGASLGELSLSLFKALSVDVPDDEPCAGVQQALADRVTDTLGSAGNDGDTAGQIDCIRLQDGLPFYPIAMSARALYAWAPTVCPATGRQRMR